MPRPQFMMINGKAVCIVTAKGKANRRNKKREETAKLQAEKNKEAQEMKISHTR